MTFKSFINDLLSQKKLLPSHLAEELGISHGTVSRWLSGTHVPSVRSCNRLAKFSGIPVEKVLEAAGHISLQSACSRIDLPEFSEYSRLKYAEELDEDTIAMIEDLIRRRRMRKAQS